MPEKALPQPEPQPARPRRSRAPGMKTALPPAPAPVPSRDQARRNQPRAPREPAPGSGVRSQRLRGVWGAGLILALLTAVALLIGQHNPTWGTTGTTPSC